MRIDLNLFNEKNLHLIQEVLQALRNTLYTDETNLKCYNFEIQTKPMQSWNSESRGANSAKVKFPKRNRQL